MFQLIGRGLYAIPAPFTVAFTGPCPGLYLWKGLHRR